MLIGRNDEGCCVSFESFAYQKLGCVNAYELGPGEIVRITEEGWETLAPPGEDMRICAFLWTYYGYPNSTYEGVNVELMRYKNGELMAKDEAERGASRRWTMWPACPTPACPTPSVTPIAAASPLPGPS